MDALGLTKLFDGVISIDEMTMFGDLRPKPDARMLRRVAALLRVPTHRCVLVEDTLVHQKAARRVGMRAVWMQRYLGGRFRGTVRGGRNAGWQGDATGRESARSRPTCMPKSARSASSPSSHDALARSARWRTR